MPVVSKFLTDCFHSQTLSSQAADNDTRTQTEMLQLSPGVEKTHYGTSGNITCSMDNQKSTDREQKGGHKGCDNNGYQPDDYLK